MIDQGPEVVTNMCVMSEHFHSALANNPRSFSVPSRQHLASFDGNYGPQLQNLVFWHAVAFSDKVDEIILITEIERFNLDLVPRFASKANSVKELIKIAGFGPLDV